MSEEINAQPKADLTDVTPEIKEEVKIKVKHLDEEREITLEEAKALAQKGMDYDRIRQKYDGTKPVLSALEKLAAKRGITVEEMISATEAADEEREVQTIAQRPSEEVSKELYETKKRLEKYEAMEAEAQKKNKEKEFINNDAAKFKKMFPDVKPDDVPKEVWESVEKGELLTVAYSEYQIKTLKKELSETKKQEAAEEVNRENEETSPGRVKSAGKPDVITEEAFESMTPQERMKRWPEIKKLFKMK